MDSSDDVLLRRSDQYWTNGIESITHEAILMVGISWVLWGIAAILLEVVHTPGRICVCIIHLITLRPGSSCTCQIATIRIDSEFEPLVSEYWIMAAEKPRKMIE